MLDSEGSRIPMTLLFGRGGFSSLPLGGCVHDMNLEGLFYSVQGGSGLPLQEPSDEIKPLSGETTCSPNFKIFLPSNDFSGGKGVINPPNK